MNTKPAHELKVGERLFYNGQFCVILRRSGVWGSGKVDVTIQATSEVVCKILGYKDLVQYQTVCRVTLPIREVVAGDEVILGDKRKLVLSASTFLVPNHTTSETLETRIIQVAGQAAIHRNSDEMITIDRVS